MAKQGSNSELFAHENNALTARSQLHFFGERTRNMYYVLSMFCLH